jgi:hypothetical protein
MLKVMVSRLKSTTKKALRAPNVPLGIVRVLDLFETNGKQEILYDSAVRHLSDIFVCSAQTVEGYLQGLVSQGHLAIVSADKEGIATSGRRMIKILTPHLLQTVMHAPKPE